MRLKNVLFLVSFVSIQVPNTKTYRQFIVPLSQLKMERRSRLVFVSDFVLSFMWVCSGVVVRLIVFNILGFSHTHLAEIVKLSFSIANMFLFAFLAKVTRGGVYNPLTVLADAISGNFWDFLFCVGCRIPAQVYLL